MNKPIFENDKEFIQLLIDTYYMKSIDHNGEYFKIYSKSGIERAIKKGYIKKSDLEKARDVFFKYIESNGYDPRELTEYIYQLCKLKDELEKEIKKLKEGK